MLLQERIGIKIRGGVLTLDGTRATMKSESCREEEEGGRLWEELQEKLEGEIGCNLRGRGSARDHERAARGVG